MTPCTGCGLSLPPEAFGVSHKARNGGVYVWRSTRCLACERARVTALRRSRGVRPRDDAGLRSERSAHMAARWDRVWLPAVAALPAPERAAILADLERRPPTVRERLDAARQRAKEAS